MIIDLHLGLFDDLLDLAILANTDGRNELLSRGAAAVKNVGGQFTARESICVDGSLSTLSAKLPVQLSLYLVWVAAKINCPYTDDSDLTFEII
jgi:hypothetical protein